MNWHGTTFILIYSSPLICPSYLNIHHGFINTRLRSLPGMHSGSFLTRRYIPCYTGDSFFIKTYIVRYVVRTSCYTTVLACMMPAHSRRMPPRKVRNSSFVNPGPVCIFIHMLEDLLSNNKYIVNSWNGGEVVRRWGWEEQRGGGVDISTKRCTACRNN